jgi:putative ABC transport system permease protein
MRQLRALLARLAGLFGGGRTDDELLDEMQAHLEMETAENVRRGMDPATARRRALLAAGGMTQAAEAVKDQRGLPAIDRLVADIRFAFRTLRHHASFTIVVVLTLALGIGANTAIFSVVRGVLLKPLPHHEGDRLVYLHQSSDALGGANLTFSVPEVRDLRVGVPSLGGGIAEYSPWTSIINAGGYTTRVSVGLVTGNYFEVMGLAPIHGQLTRPADDGPGVPAVMVLTHEFWMRRFGGDPAVVNTQVRVNGTPASVIGVLQPAPFFPLRMDVLMNMVISEHHLSAAMTEMRDHRMTEVVARLAPGASLATAGSEVSAIFRRLQRDHPEAYGPASRPRVEVVPFKKAIGEQAELPLWLLMGAAAFVLIIAVANVANLTLMRNVRRERELVIRSTLGAGAARLRRLILTENMVLAFLGAGIGVLVAVAGVPLLVSLAARYSPRANEIELDATVLAFTLVLAVGAALFFSLLAPLPAEGTLATAASLGRHAAGGLRKQRLQRGLVVVQVAVSVVLLAGAGLLTRTMLRLANVPTGLQTEEILTLRANLFAGSGPRRDEAAIEEARTRFAEIRDQIAALPGVVAVGIGSAPLQTELQFDLDVEGRPLAPGAPVYRADWRGADSAYFAAAGIPLIRGRVFDSLDHRRKLMVVNQTFADQLFPGEDAIGHRVAVAGVPVKLGVLKKDDWHTIVGVIGNTRDGGLDAKPIGAFYTAIDQETATGGTLVIRAERDAGANAQAATDIIHRVAPQSLVERVKTVADIKDESVTPRRLNAVLISTFGILAVLIAAVGMAGVLAFSVSARTHEIGIRMSLGAASGTVLRMILREGGSLVAMGLGAGLAGALFGGRVIRGLLYGVEPNDPATLAAVGVVMAAIGLAACWIPATRAARIDPAITMRSG